MSLTVTLNAVDITSLLVGEVNITRAEEISATASFGYRVAGPPGEPHELIRQLVIIEWSGSRIYRGFVNDAVWDMDNRVFRIDCSDLFQEAFEGLEPDQIVAMIPGSSWTEPVFGEVEDGWSTALDVFSTVSKESHMDLNGTVQTVDWAAKGTPDRILQEDVIINDGAYELVLAKGRDIITQVKLVYRYQYSRWKTRLHKFSWSFSNHPQVGDWCDWLLNWLFELPKKDQIFQAAEGTGWGIYRGGSHLSIGGDGVAFTEHPDSGQVCGGTEWLNTPEWQALTALSASWYGFRNFAQTILEIYEITLNAIAAQGAYGVTVKDFRADSQIEADDASFEQQDVPADTVANPWPTDTIGDFFEDQLDLSIRDDDLNCLMAVGQTYLRKQLRKNSVSVETVIDPTFNLNQTVEIDTPDILARGKIREINHRLGVNRSVTKITIAVSTGRGGNQDPLIPPTRPNTSPTHPPPEDTTSLPTRIGGNPDSPPFEDDWDGWSTNDRTWLPTDEVYPWRFKVDGPDIEPEARDDVEVTRVAQYEILIPQDTLILR